MALTFTDEELEEMSIVAIKNYLNKNFSDQYIKKHFAFAIKRFISNTKTLDSSKVVGASSISENGSSISFREGIEAGTITDDIKALLPNPYIRMC